jgi:hypothetical protein
MVAQGRPSLLVAILQSLCSLIRQCRDRHAGENRILTLECRTDDQHYSIEHGARNVHPQRIQAFKDNLRPQDETFGGQRVFSCERCGEEFPSREELKTVSWRLGSSDLKLTGSTTRAHLLMELERNSRLISLLLLPLDHGPLPSSNWAVSIPISNYLPSDYQAKIAKRPWSLDNPTTRMNLLPRRQSLCTSTLISTLTVPKAPLHMIRPPQLLKIPTTRVVPDSHRALDPTTRLSHPITRSCWLDPRRTFQQELQI